MFDFKCPQGHELHAFIYHHRNEDQINNGGLSGSNRSKCSLCDEEERCKGMHYVCSSLDIIICKDCIPDFQMMKVCHICKQHITESFIGCRKCDIDICKSCIQRRQQHDATQAEIYRMESSAPSQFSSLLNHCDEKHIIVDQYWLSRIKATALPLCIAPEDIHYCIAPEDIRNGIVHVSSSPETSTWANNIRCWLSIVQSKKYDPEDFDTWNGMNLEYAPEYIRNNQKIVMVAIENSCGFALKFATPELRNNKQVVLSAVQQDGISFVYASTELRGDKDFVLQATEQDHSNSPFKFASPDLQNDKSFVMDAVRIENKYAWLFQYASPGIKQNKDFILQLVQQDDCCSALSLAFVTPELQNDKQVVLAAVQHSKYGEAFAYASPKLKCDKDFILHLFQQVDRCVRVLEFVPPYLQRDKQVVLEAVLNSPSAIKFASEDLKRDPEVLVATFMFDADHDTIRKENTKKIVLSTRYSLNPTTDYAATGFTRRFKDSNYIKKKDEFIVYAPNAFDKQTCDLEWTNYDHPCRGTKDTCTYKNVLTKDGKPTDVCCWRYSFRSQLEEAKSTGGFMIQIVESGVGIAKKTVLGKGQKIELDMASLIDVKVFQVYDPEDDDGDECAFEDRHIDTVTGKISQWYDNHCQDMSVTVIHQKYGDDDESDEERSD